MENTYQPYQKLLDDAIELENNGRISEAIALYLNIIKLSPNYRWGLGVWDQLQIPYDEKAEALIQMALTNSKGQLTHQ